MYAKHTPVVLTVILLFLLVIYWSITKLAPPPSSLSRKGLGPVPHPHHKSSLLRYLFPRASLSAQKQLIKLQLDTLPYYKSRAQSQVWRFILARQKRHQARKEDGTSVIEYLRKRSRRFLGFGRRHKAASTLAENARQKEDTMTQPSSYGGAGTDAEAASGIEKGGRRKKLAGYLRAANELRMSYKQVHSNNTERDSEQDKPGIPGAFPDVAIATHGDEELVLFPSYCKRHFREEPQLPPPRRGSKDRNSQVEEQNDAEIWKKEWDRWESDKAIVDVDVRGWLYSPHRGAMNRKNRLLVGLARQLSGVPAPKNDNSKSRDNSPEPYSLRARHEAHQDRRDQERIRKEAEELLRKGEDEGRAAAQGAYSEEPKDDSDAESIYSERGRSGHVTPGNDEPPGPGHLKTRASWNAPSDMNAAELASANKNLMTRLMPFLTNPLVATPITLFFYDKETSQSKTVVTNDAGHFAIRAALDFLPTHVRVLASEDLSATAEIKITEPKGVSLISDVDDTIKHSSIGSGAREIFRNAFIRDLSDLSIDGVKEWYNTMYDMGVGIHYVSNSPWQLFPVLVSFFSTAELPPGSYHLKQYSGMLQGIFEPVAERKKGTLERIMKDFPERKFVLVGDSGEADLEVYTDVVLANPGRIIAVFIRDVTSPQDQGFFDSTTDKSRRKITKTPSRGWSDDSGIDTMNDRVLSRPRLPPRMHTETAVQSSTGPAMGKLIDFSDDQISLDIHESHSRVMPRSTSDLEQLETMSSLKSMTSPKPAPARPNKPLALRSSATGNGNPVVVEDPSISSQPPPPPPPSRPRNSRAPSEDRNSSSTNHPLSQSINPADIASPIESQGYFSSARNKVASAYNAIPPPSSYLPGSQQTTTTTGKPQRPVPPPRRGLTASAAAYASNRLSWTSRSSSPTRRNPTSADESDDESYTAQLNGAPVNKKLDLWRRRWRRAEQVLAKEGVELRSWRVGSDVAHEAVQLVERTMKEMGVADASRKDGGERKVLDFKD